jgi:hypothetical protein
MLHNMCNGYYSCLVVFISVNGWFQRQFCRKNKFSVKIAKQYVICTAVLVGITIDYRIVLFYSIINGITQAYCKDRKNKSMPLLPSCNVIDLPVYCCYLRRSYTDRVFQLSTIKFIFYILFATRVSDIC